MKALRRRNNDKASVATRAIAPTASGPQAPPRIPTSPPTTVELRGVKIHFPFRPYQCQEDYMNKVLDALNRGENALLESPTGTGKTLCLLCSTLAWQRQQASGLHTVQVDAGDTTNTSDLAQTKRPSARIPTIIYASRTHSQLSQVVRELRNTRYRPKHAVLGSREQMCVNPKVKKATSSASDINHECSRLGKERKCAMRNRLEGFTPPSTEQGSNTNYQPVMDMEELVQMGSSRRVCPFYYTRSLVEDAELILVPYNYLFDRDSRTTTLADVPWNNAIVIFDEAHNLESFASESASFDLTTTDIAGCVGEIDRAMNYLQLHNDGDTTRVKPENILKIKSLLLDLEAYIMNLNTAKTAYRGEYMMEILTKGAKITHANHELFIQEVRKLNDVFLEQYAGNQSRAAPKLDQFVQCIKRVFGETTEARCFAKAQSYRVHVTPKQGMANTRQPSTVGRTISYWCFAPSEAMRELASLNVRSILVTSGTLSPLESYALELDLPFPNRLENPHIIPDDQIHVRVVGKGVSGKVLSSSYERRQDAEYFLELGNTLVSVANVVPGGMLVFFPSYGVMETCIERWGGPSSTKAQYQKGKSTSNFFAARKKAATGSSRYSFPSVKTTSHSATREPTNPWKRLLNIKSVVVEPKSTSDLPDAIAEFHKYLNMEKSRGVCLFGVCRGKISEGIDFAHDMCRAVVITGLPFAPSFDPKVKMKREFLDQNRACANLKVSGDAGFGVEQGKQNSSLSGHEWYTQQAHRAVNQAIGRVIRNKIDYGAVLLLDSRFSLPGNQQGLSKWVRPHILPDEGLGKAISSLVKFYKKASEKASARKEGLPQRTPNQVSVILQYEDEPGKVNQVSLGEDMTKVAFIGGQGTRIRSPDLDSSQIESDDTRAANTNYIAPNHIVARVDLNSKEGTLEASKLLAKPSAASCRTEKAESREAGDAQHERPKGSETSRSGPHVQVELSSDRNPSQTAARRFFHHVQSKMTVQEQSDIKKAVVSMKQFVQQKHRKAFLQAAREVINILLRYESFENRSRDNKPEFFLLLFQLLPKHFLRDAQKWTAHTALRMSSFGKILKASLPPTDCRKSMSMAAEFLWNVWFGAESLFERNDFLIQLQKIVLTLPRPDLSQVLGALLKLLPTEVHGQTAAFIDRLRASRSITNLKQRERTNVGENMASGELFSHQKILTTDLQSAVAAPNPAERKSNPYAKAMERKSDCIYKSNGKPGSAQHDQKSKDAHVDESISRPSKVRGGISLGSLLQKQRRRGGNLQRVLESSESVTFTGKESDHAGTLSLESNAPSDLTCTICETPSPKPYIAECGHLACLSCWLQWLKKSETCPVCRKPAMKSSLALLVFGRE